MRRSAAALSVVLILAACGVEPATPEGFEPAGTPTTPKADGGEMAPKATTCHMVSECMNFECSDAFWHEAYCETPDGMGDEGCDTIDAELDACVATCADENPEATDEDVTLAVAGHTCLVRAITADEYDECRAIFDACEG